MAVASRELRALADELTERDAKMSLLGIAQALEHHATNLETAALNFGVGRRVVTGCDPGSSQLEARKRPSLLKTAGVSLSVRPAVRQLVP
jgi:hypothetical protein